MTEEQPKIKIKDTAPDFYNMRDYFAVKAMQGILQQDRPEEWGDSDGVAKCAYEYADAMLEARNK